MSGVGEKDLDWRAILHAEGRLRRPGVVDTGTIAALAPSAKWSSPHPQDGWSQAPAGPETASRWAQTLSRALGDAEARALRWLRHPPGARGLPAFEGAGFVLDLNADWRSEWGGLLLFVEPSGRVEGWRPEPGGLTLFQGHAPPVLTQVTPAALAHRLALIGEFAP